MSPSVLSTLGAALAGCMAAVGLSAVLGFQTFLYFKIFPADAQQYKFLVAWIWILDAVHTVLICTGVWDYLILHFTDPNIVETIFPVIAITVAMTAVITLSVNIFYGWRIHKLSKRNWWLTGPIAFLSIVRVGLAFTTTTEMLISETFPAFAARFKILFTSGLVVSAVTDIIVSGARYYFLRNLRQGYSMTHEAVDAVVVFTINDGCLTCAVVIASIICWLSMPHNFVYLGIYFTIAKFYANSVLATLNLRNWYRHRYIEPRPLGILKRPIRVNTDSHISPGTNSSSLPQVQPADLSGMLPQKMEVFVNRQVDYVNDFPRGDHEDSHSNSSRKSVNIA
ncbi:hypothetical protein DFH08DRAFT_852712 [Mycena albidolilacea]|uniref:DUF6534 domain-containing protein n=1 Tax=Mycena albidolilacea TaxID=1033008 RepID=A0AAD7EXJ2_9AGAR|nr:hypothetical protein DFH08DRAFT_852712 [Mycena albidolilacea]